MLSFLSLLAVRYALALALVFAVTTQAPAEQPAQPVDTTAAQASFEAPSPSPAERVIDQLLHQSFILNNDAGTALATIRRGDTPPAPLSERAVVETFSSHALTPEQIVMLWDALSSDDNMGLATLPIVKALVNKTVTPKSREALWSELSILAKTTAGRARTPASDRSMLAVFERHRVELLPLLKPVLETEGAGDEMVDLMQSSRVFGTSVTEGVTTLLTLHPAALARRIERERGRGKPVQWEQQAFEGMLKWKNAHIVPGAAKAPKSLTDRDATAETFITIFNSLHSLDDAYRARMLEGLTPVEVFNAAVGGERELYRLGTSSYREFLHPVILKGIEASGTFEAFLAKATGGYAAQASPWQRGMVFVRIASSFGLVETVLPKIRDREQFINLALDSMSDPRSFESSSTIVIDVLTGRAKPEIAQIFKRSILDQLHTRYNAGGDPARQSVYGAMLSVYQSITGDHRDKAIDRAFPIDASRLYLPHSRLFRSDGKGGQVHRIFVRLDQDIDAAVTYQSLGPLFAKLGATVRRDRNFEVYTLRGARRAIEVYVNKATAAGVRNGIADIGRELRGAPVETIIGRGHTGIITPLTKDMRRMLGEGTKDVATVFVGACGSDASVRDLIGVFGHVPYITTKATGRKVINNAFLEIYIAALLALPAGQRLSMQTVLDKSVERFIKPRGDEELREDALLYQVNLATGLAALLFDTHVRKHIQ